MISYPLWVREWKANSRILFLFLAILTLYGGVILAMYDPDLSSSLQMMANQMPDLFAAFGMSGAGASLIEFITNYLYGFLLIVIPFLCIVILCHRLVVRYIDRGSMAYLITSEYSRKTIMITQALFLISFLAILVLYMTGFLMILSTLLYEEAIPLQEFLTLNFALYGLLLLFAGIQFLSAVSFNETKWATGLGAGIGIAFILIQMLSQVSDKISFLQYMTITSFFQSDAILHLENGIWINILLMYGLSVVCFILAVQIFKKRDLPL